MASASASGTTALPCLPGWYNNAERYPDMSLLLQTSSEVQPRPTKRRRTRSTALVQHREVQLHAGFVASHSNYFRTRLENTENFGMARRGGGAKVLEEVFHSDAEVSAAEVVLRFMYEGRLEEGVVHDVEQLLLAYMVADRWETPGCMSACQACIQDLARPQPAEPLSLSAINHWYSLRHLNLPTDLRSALDQACLASLQTLFPAPQDVLGSASLQGQFFSLQLGPVVDWAAQLSSDAASMVAATQGLLKMYCESPEGVQVMQQLEAGPTPGALLQQLEGSNIARLMRLRRCVLMSGAGDDTTRALRKLAELCMCYVEDRFEAVWASSGEQQVQAAGTLREQFLSLDYLDVLGVAEVVPKLGNCTGNLTVLLQAYADQHQGPEWRQQVLAQLEGLQAPPLLAQCSTLISAVDQDMGLPQVQALLDLPMQHVLTRLGDIPRMLVNHDARRELFSLDVNSVARFLQADALRVTSENDVLLLVLEYFKHRQVQDLQQRNKLLAQVRMRQLSPFFLTKVVPVVFKDYPNLMKLWPDVMYGRMVPHFDGPKQGPPAWHAGPRTGGPSVAPTSLTWSISKEQLQQAERELGRNEGDVKYVKALWSPESSDFILGGFRWSAKMQLQRLAVAPDGQEGRISYGLFYHNNIPLEGLINEGFCVAGRALEAQLEHGSFRKYMKHSKALLNWGYGYFDFFSAPDGRKGFSGADDPGLQRFFQGEPPAMTVTLRLEQVDGPGAPP